MERRQANFFVRSSVRPDAQFWTDEKKLDEKISDEKLVVKIFSTNNFWTKHLAPFYVRGKVLKKKPKGSSTTTTTSSKMTTTRIDCPQQRRRLGASDVGRAGLRDRGRAIPVSESGRKLTRPKLLAKRPHRGGHWPGKIIEQRRGRPPEDLLPLLLHFGKIPKKIGQILAKF